MKPFFDTDHLTQVRYRSIGRMPEKINTGYKHQHIKDPGDDDPLPQFMFADKLVGPDVRLNGYDNFLKQMIVFRCRMRRLYISGSPTTFANTLGIAGKQE